MYLEKVYTVALSHTRHFMNVLLEVLQHTVAYSVHIISKSRTCNKTSQRSDQQLPSVHYKARRVGELRMSTDSALLPPLL